MTRWPGCLIVAFCTANWKLGGHRILPGRIWHWCGYFLHVMVTTHEKVSDGIFRKRTCWVRILFFFNFQNFILFIFFIQQVLISYLFELEFFKMDFSFVSKTHFRSHNFYIRCGWWCSVVLLGVGGVAVDQKFQGEEGDIRLCLLQPWLWEHSLQMRQTEPMCVLERVVIQEGKQVWLQGS